MSSPEVLAAGRPVLDHPVDATMTDDHHRHGEDDAASAPTMLAGAIGSGAPGTPGIPGRGINDGRLLAGRYKVLRFIAGGGMGEVYEVDDALLGERVAIKLLRAELSVKPAVQARFADEIRLARKVTHPNVCRVFDVGHDGAHVFYTMELHLGETLAARLRRVGRLEVDEARPIIRQLLAGVGAAHAVDVVHTDLKPSNVLLTGSGNQRVVLTDFGLAVPCCATLGCHCEQPHLIGTPAYMAPEQVTGDSLVETTVLFSIGVILFEMMTGELPWQGATPPEMAQARLSGPTPSARALRPDLDPRWCDVIRCCLARANADRPRSAAAVAQALALD